MTALVRPFLGGQVGPMSCLENGQASFGRAGLIRHGRPTTPPRPPTGQLQDCEHKRHSATETLPAIEDDAPFLKGQGGARVC